MSPAEALADLTEVSTQIRAAVLAEREGDVLASTLSDERANEVAAAARAALEALGSLRVHGDADVNALEAAVDSGSLFVATDDGVLLAATTEPDEPAGLVLYDLRRCLRRLKEEG
jgi:predicted regulator of Ras-like GTPase activity (Roadblock/LC7/MglB family)